MISLQPADRSGTFRRRRFTASHRRPSLILQLLRPLLAALLLVGIPLAAAAWVAGSPRFRLREVAVGGNEQASGEWIAEALAPLRGRHLLTLSLFEVEKRLAAHPWIRGAAIHKQLPDRLQVEVIERRPVALQRSEEGLRYLDAEGLAFAPYDPAGPADLPLLSLAPASYGEASLDVGEALHVVAELARTAPRWAEGLSELEALGRGDYRVHTAALPFPITLSAGRTVRGVRALQRHLGEIERRYPKLSAIDLRFSGQIVIKPAVQPSVRGG